MAFIAGAPRKFAATVSLKAEEELAVPHGLGTADCVVGTYEAGAGDQANLEIHCMVRVDAENVYLTTSLDVELRVVVIG